MKHYFKLLLVALMLLCSTVATAHDFEVDGIYYNITSSTNETVSVTSRGVNDEAYSDEYIGDVTIPSAVIYNGTKYSVTGITFYAFKGCTSLRSVTIPGSVTHIGYGALFEGCKALRSIVVDEGNTTYDSRENCNAII